LFLYLLDLIELRKTAVEQKEFFYRKLGAYIETRTKQLFRLNLNFRLKNFSISTYYITRYIAYTLNTDLPVVIHEEIFYKVADYHASAGHCDRNKTSL